MQFLPIRPLYRSMQPCWLWTPSRSSTVDSPTSGKQNIFLLFSLLLYSLLLNCTWGYHLYWLRFSVCEVVEMWHVHLWAVSLWCHQVFTGCWGFTEANRRSECNSQEQSECFSFFVFILLNLQRCSSVKKWLQVHRYLNISFSFLSPFLSDFCECWVGALSVENSKGNSSSISSSCRRSSQPGSS